MKIRPLYRFFIWLLFILLIVFGFLIYYFQHHEKELFLTALRSSLDQNISASDVDYDFPFGFSLDDFQIEGLIQAEKLTAQLDLSSLREKKLIIRELVLQKPAITWRMIRQSASGTTAATPPETETPLPSSGPAEARLMIKKLQLVNGSLFVVNKNADQIFSFQLDNMQSQIDQLSFPLQAITTSFRLTGKLIKEGLPLSGSVVKANGWINIIQKDLEVNLLILENDGQAGLSAHAIAENNDMEVKGKIKTMNLFTNSSEKPLESAVDNIVFNTLSSIGVEIGANFSFNTKMDNFSIGQITFSGNVSTPVEP